MFRIFHYLDMVCQEQSFSRAAQMLFLSQPSLSLTIKNFEQQIGLQIFDRSTMPIQLTSGGKVYMEGVRQILCAERDLNLRLTDCRESGDVGFILGAPHMFASRFLPPVIALFLQKHPGVNIRVEETDSLTLQRIAQRGAVDMIIGTQQFNTKQFECIPLIHEHVLLAVPASDPINEEFRAAALSSEDIRLNRHLNPDWPYVSIASFREHQFLSMREGHNLYAGMMQLCKNNGFTPNILMFLSQLTTAYNLVANQVGIALATDTLIKLAGDNKNVIFYKIDETYLSRQIQLAYRKDSFVSGSMQDFIQLMQEIGSAGLERLSQQTSVV